MKSRPWLISVLVILFNSAALATDIDPEILYAKAKAAYAKSDCKTTVYYLDKYIKIGKPTDERRSSITRVREWCKERNIISHSSTNGISPSEKANNLGSIDIR